jgi:hypothetical protein
MNTNPARKSAPIALISIGYSNMIALPIARAAAVMALLPEAKVVTRQWATGKKGVFVINDESITMTISTDEIMTRSAYDKMQEDLRAEETAEETAEEKSAE